MIAGFICEKTQDKIPFQDCLDCARTRVNRKLDCPFDEATIAGMIMNESEAGRDFRDDDFRVPEGDVYQQALRRQCPAIRHVLGFPGPDCP